MCRGQEVPSSQAMMGTSDTVLLLEQKVLLGGPGAASYHLHWPILHVRPCLGLWPSPMQRCALGLLFAPSQPLPPPQARPSAPPRLEGCCCPLLTLLVQASIVSLLTGGSDLLQSLPASSLTLSKQSFTLQLKNIL